MQKLDLEENWKFNKVRITLFFDNLPTGKADQHFLNIFGVDAEDVSEKKSIGESTATSPIDGGKININQAGNRINIVIEATETSIESPLPLIKDSTEISRYFEKSESWLKNQKAIIRMAIAFNTSLECDTREHSYKKLSNLIKFCEIDHETMDDFKIQVNRPRQSKTFSSATLNRIASFNSIEIEVGEIIADTENPLKEIIFTNASIEVNTSTENIDPFPSEKLDELFNEIKASSFDILNNGI